ncbi:MAG: hypothetical protein HC819_12995 [Cyclobacteriaceae bacterium]|nr:hypothetical protein [Cyclobacteriaceae bacterium]
MKFASNHRIRIFALIGIFLVSFTTAAIADVVIVKAKGTKANGVFAHFSVFANDQELGKKYTNCAFEEYSFNLPFPTEEIREVKIKFDNDLTLGEEDRNLFVCSITIGNLPTINTMKGTAKYFFQNGKEQEYHGMMGRNGTLVIDISAIRFCPDNVVLSSQAQINAFNYHCIKGSLTISGNDIVDLSPLAVLTSIKGPLNIKENPKLVAVSGMDALVEISFLSITNNPLLERIDGFNSMQKCGGIMVSGNERLKTIKCFHTPNL